MILEELCESAYDLSDHVETGGGSHAQAKVEQFDFKQ